MAAGSGMRLQQFQELKIWHLREGRRHPVEKAVWDGVLTLWVLGLVGSPTAFLIHTRWAEYAAICAIFLPGTYVGLRRWMHRRHWLRCDWIVALID
jgi:hypothetical protein